MKHKDTVAPYVLASMHPMMHLALLTTGIALHMMDNDKFYNIPNADQCDAKAGSKAYRFIHGGDKFWYIGLISLAHLISVVFHYIDELLVAQGKRFQGNIFLVIKIFFYMYAVFKVQAGIIFDDCRATIVDDS